MSHNHCRFFMASRCELHLAPLFSRLCNIRGVLWSVSAFDNPTHAQPTAGMLPRTLWRWGGVGSLPRVCIRPQPSWDLGIASPWLPVTSHGGVLPQTGHHVIRYICVISVFLFKFFLMNWWMIPMDSKPYLLSSKPYLLRRSASHLSFFEVFAQSRQF